MRLNVRDTIGHSRELIWTTYRDELPEVAPFLPNIARIETLEREAPEEGVIRLLNRWHAIGEIPKVAQRFVKPEMLCWTERVIWDENTWVCAWEIEPAFFTQYIRIEGASGYHDAGPERCEIHIDGVLEVDVSGMRGVPRLLSGRVNKAAEKMVSALILPNLQRLNASVARMLDARRDSS